MNPISVGLIGLGRHGMRYARHLLETPVPETVTAALRPAGPNVMMRPIMDALFERALMPEHPSCSDAFTPLARWLLYVRGHYLRMPLRLLIPHLTRKAWKRRETSEKPATEG